MTESAQVFQGVHDTPVYTNFLRQAAAPVGGHHRRHRSHRDSTGHRVAAGLRPRPRRLRLGPAGHRGAGRRRRVNATHAAPTPRSGYARGAAQPVRACTAAPPMRTWPRHPTPSPTSPSPATASTRTLCSPGCATTCNPPNAASAWPKATAAWRANCLPAPGSTGSQYPKISANCCGPCCTGTATSPPGYRPARQMHPHLAAGQPAHPHLLVSHSGGRGPRRAQPHRTDHQGQGLARRPRQGLRLLTGGLPPPGAGHHHRPARRVHGDAGQRGHDRLVLAPQRISRFIHRPAAPPPVRRARMAGSQLPAAEFDEGDQAHRPPPAVGAALGSLLEKGAANQQPRRTAIPTAIRRSCPSPTHPSKESASQAPNSSPPSTISTPAPPSTSPSTSSCAASEMEAVRNDRAKENIDDQFEQRQDVRNGDAELRATRRQLAEYERLLTTSADERPLEAAFLIAVGRPRRTHPRLQHQTATRRTGQLRPDRGALLPRRPDADCGRLSIPVRPTTRPASTSSATPPRPRNGRASCPSSPPRSATPPESCWDSTKATPSTAQCSSTCPAPRGATTTPAWCAAAPPATASPTPPNASRAARSSAAHRHSSSTPTSPNGPTPWPTSPTQPSSTWRATDFGCDPLRIFPDRVAGSYWLDYMVPMMGLDTRSTAVARLRTLLTAQAAASLGITSTAALMDYIASLQAPAHGPDTRPPAVAAPRRRTATRAGRACNPGPPTTSPKPSSTTPCPYPT